MKYETLRGLTLPKIGFGTWKIGGGSRPQPKRDPDFMRALLSALDLGYTHFDTAETYAAGHSEELLGRALRESRTDRARVFLTTKVAPSHLDYNGVLRSCDASLRRLSTDYVDLYLIHWPTPGMNLKNAFEALNILASRGKIRHVGVSNFSLELLQESRRLSASPILTNQLPYSLEERSYVKNGVLEYCQLNDILLTAYSPLEQGSLRSRKILSSVAAAHSATSFQIALAWLCNQPRVITIPMSMDPTHQRQNLEAGDITLTPAELQQLV
jgi:diketogulonate reductase-like aldo/keto reductase